MLIIYNFQPLFGIVIGHNENFSQLSPLFMLHKIYRNVLLRGKSHCTNEMLVNMHNNEDVYYNTKIKKNISKDGREKKE